MSNGKIIVKLEKLWKKAIVSYWNFETGDRERRKLPFGIDELRVDFHSLLSLRAFGRSDNYRLRPYVVFIAQKVRIQVEIDGIQNKCFENKIKIS